MWIEYRPPTHHHHHRHMRFWPVSEKCAAPLPYAINYNTTAAILLSAFHHPLGLDFKVNITFNYRGLEYSQAWLPWNRKLMKFPASASGVCEDAAVRAHAPSHTHKRWLQSAACLPAPRVLPQVTLQPVILSQLW